MFFKNRTTILQTQNTFYENKKYSVYPWFDIFISWLRTGSNTGRGSKRKLPSLQASKITFNCCQTGFLLRLRALEIFQQQMF
jgi:hypothetical protein